MRKKALPLLIILMIGAGSAFLGMDLQQHKAAIIKLEGSITPSSSGFRSSGITPEQVRELNSKAEKQGADAIIYEWNSGGGAVVASKEIMRAIDRVEVPTVCRFRDIAASGAYLSSLGCDRIVADSATLTGSIGVKSSYLEFSGLLDKFGIEYVNISSGKYKESTSPYQNISEEERKLMKRKVEIVHEQFLELVQTRRNLSEEEMEKVETGQLFLGSEAKKIGLVDELGGRKEALRSAEELANKNMTRFKVEPTKNFDLFSLLTSDSWIRFFIKSDSSAPMKAEWN